jgi:hypothetical protein
MAPPCGPGCGRRGWTSFAPRGSLLLTSSTLALVFSEKKHGKILGPFDVGKSLKVKNMQEKGDLLRSVKTK